MLIPAEIITDILSRLPVKTLKRFRCVSKSWCKETESPYFINMHLQKLTQARTNLGLILGDRSSTKLYTVDLDKPNPTNSMELFKTIALYNPCTREYKILPSTLFELRIPSGKEYDKFCWERTLYGFGYDPINEDYKVVKIVDYYGNTIDRCFFSEVKVYSLMKSNSWKRIKGYPNYYAIFQPDAVHWTASTEIIRRDLSPTMIVAFGFGVEGFRIIAKPADYLANEHDYFDLGVLGGCLCLLCAKMCFRVQIWAMKDSWSKLCTVVSELQVDRFNFYVRTLAYSKSEDKVLLELDKTFFVLCDSRMRKSELVKIHGAPEMVTTEIFVGSLVSTKK
ncbi:hypothetical protein POPTR_006G012900v4 [Populus trichocarpa]|uniref:Uncharacterized protein n=1 Tax=Populus trichocarpa TaxID=3694 RepID=A0ACC0SSH4_POPTR|nr:hypothetical protein POPTR_006G012900v4 [Populus trichocarpa]